MGLGGHSENKKSASQEYYTQRDLLYHLYVANGHKPLDLDPCSPAKGQQAPTYPFVLNHFTKDDNSLNQKWFGKVFVNPPFNNIEPFFNKAWSELAAGNVESVVFFVPARIDQPWYMKYVEGFRCPNIAFTRRVYFSVPSLRYIREHDLGEKALEQTTKYYNNAMSRLKLDKSRQRVEQIYNETDFIPQAQYDEYMRFIFMGNYKPFARYLMALPFVEFPIFKNVHGVIDFRIVSLEGGVPSINSPSYNDNSIVSLLSHYDFVKMHDSIILGSSGNISATSKRAARKPLYGTDLYASEEIREVTLMNYISVLEASLRKELQRLPAAHSDLPSS